MEPMSHSLLYEAIIASLVLLAGLIYLFLTSNYNYWKDRGVPFNKPKLLFGSLKDQFLQKKSPNELYQGFYDEFKGHRYGGFYEIKNPILLIRDPELVEKVLIKDFTHFYNRGFPAAPKEEYLTSNLFNLEGKVWRNLRYKLTPTFTSGKLKGMFEQICNCGDELIKCIEEERKKSNTVEGKPLLAAFAFEIIASVAFGLQLDKDSEANIAFRKVVDSLFKPSRLQLFKFLAILYKPKLARKLGVRQFNKDMEATVMTLIKGTLDYRDQKNIKRNDFFQLLINLRDQEKEGKFNVYTDVEHSPEDDVIDQMKHAAKEYIEEIEDGGKDEVFMTDEIIAAQSFIFFTAGSESVSSTSNLALLCLSQNQEIQERAYKEIDTVLKQHDNKWSYPAMKEMTYLDQVIQEAMRMYPIAPILFRVCTEPYKIPDSDLVVEKGVKVIIPVMAIQNDPQYHESPEVFNPDRFENNNYRPSGTYLPFGDGPRICIAMRFAALEVKVVLAKILSQYNVKLSSKTKIPFEYKKSSFLLSPEEDFCFEFYKRS
uniref:Cytochrome P450 n=1 Tax=Clastoptera arizonana TaxID=38151 RepID=A0A1B6CF87_9HEMI